jgi:hypothetical protein
VAFIRDIIDAFGPVNYIALAIGLCCVVALVVIQVQGRRHVAFDVSSSLDDASSPNAVPENETEIESARVEGDKSDSASNFPSDAEHTTPPKKTAFKAYVPSAE